MNGLGAAVVLATILALAGPAAATTGSVTILVEAAGGNPPAGIHLEVIAASGDTTSELVILTRGRGEVEVELVGASPWRLRPAADGFWSPELRLDADDLAALEEPLHSTLWPTTSVTGTLVLEDAGEPPGEVRLTLRRVLSSRPPERQPAGEPEITCTVDRGARFTGCSLPAGLWNLRLEAAGYAPRYLWHLRLQAAAVAELKVPRLRRGASVLGRAATEDGPADPAQATVELLPLGDRHTLGSDAQEELEQMTRTTGINDWGYFEFQAVSPGVYELTVRQPGYPPQTVAPLRVADGDGLELRQVVVLERPLRLALTVDPVRDISGRPWQVKLLREDRLGALETVEEGTVERGEWRSQPHPPGPYVLRLLAHDGAVLEWRAFELTEDLQPLEVQLDLVAVEGRVVLGEEPLVARLWFGGRNGSVILSAVSDADGAFELVLPRAGIWPVDVRSENPKVTVRGLEVDVPDRANSGPAEVLVAVPDTLVFGEVVDSEGDGVRGARVILVGAPTPAVRAARISADERGRFEIRGHTPGKSSLQASARDRKSSLATVELVEGRPTGPVRLVLEKSARWRGRVEFAGEPVAAAKVLAVPLSPRGQLGALSVPQTRTASDGSFKLELPTDTLFVRLIVLAPGFTLHLSRVAAGAAQPIVVELGFAGGTLVLPRRPPETGSTSAELLLIGGEPVDLTLLPMWAQLSGSPPGNGPQLVVPAMPPGSYARCALEPDEALLIFAGTALPAATACTEGYLEPGGQLVLGGE